MNTFGNKVRVGNNIYHPIHEYNDTLKNIYLDDFRHSEEFKLTCTDSGRTNITYDGRAVRVPQAAAGGISLLPRWVSC